MKISPVCHHLSWEFVLTRPDFDIQKVTALGSLAGSLIGRQSLPYLAVEERCYPGVSTMRD